MFVVSGQMGPKALPFGQSFRPEIHYIEIRRADGTYGTDKSGSISYNFFINHIFRPDKFFLNLLISQFVLVGQTLKVKFSNPKFLYL